MTPEEIISNNIKIAKFVGFTPVSPNFKSPDLPYKYHKMWPRFDQALYVSEVTKTSVGGRFKSKDITQRVNHDEFEFDYNLGWLMPVIEKIEVLEDNCFVVKIDGQTCSIYNRESKAEYCSNTRNTKVEAVYASVLEFIDIYNDFKVVETQLFQVGEPGDLYYRDSDGLVKLLPYIQ